MAKPTVVYFVTWPDGKMFEGTQTSISAEMAVGRALLTWLIPVHFPGLELGTLYGYGVLAQAWKAMQRGGFRLHEIEVPADGVSY